MLTLDREKIEILQAKKGIPSEELTANTGLTRGTIFSMKNGKPCRPTSVHKLAKALGVDVTELLKGD